MRCENDNINNLCFLTMKIRTSTRAWFQRSGREKPSGLLKMKSSSKTSRRRTRFSQLFALYVYWCWGFLIGSARAATTLSVGRASMAGGKRIRALAFSDARIVSITPYSQFQSGEKIEYLSSNHGYPQNQMQVLWETCLIVLYQLPWQPLPPQTTKMPHTGLPSVYHPPRSRTTHQRLCISQGEMQILYWRISSICHSRPRKQLMSWANNQVPQCRVLARAQSRRFLGASGIL